MYCQCTIPVALTPESVALPLGVILHRNTTGAWGLGTRSIDATMRRESVFFKRLFGGKIGKILDWNSLNHLKLGHDGSVKMKKRAQIL